MEAANQPVLRAQLSDRKRRLQDAISAQGELPDLVRLLTQVDSALGRMQDGSYGSCDVCHEEIEDEHLLGNPLIRYCLCEISEPQQRALEQDLTLAARIQGALLPQQDLYCCGWRAHYRYEPAGLVSGDICDIITRGDEAEEIYFVLGDVSGKGFAASLLMAHLNASFRSLIHVGLPVNELVERASQILLRSTIASHYATLVCGRTRHGGEVEICNAGHCPPLVVSAGGVRAVEATGYPVGMIAGGSYTTRTLRLGAGETLFLYTDGLTEAWTPERGEYGAERMTRVLEESRSLPPRDLVDACRRDQAEFLAGAQRQDDMSLLALRWGGEPA